MLCYVMLCYVIHNTPHHYNSTLLCFHKNSKTRFHESYLWESVSLLLETVRSPLGCSGALWQCPGKCGGGRLSCVMLQLSDCLFVCLFAFLLVSICACVCGSVCVCVCVRVCGCVCVCVRVCMFLYSRNHLLLRRSLCLCPRSACVWYTIYYDFCNISLVSLRLHFFSTFLPLLLFSPLSLPLFITPSLLLSFPPPLLSSFPPLSLSRYHLHLA